MLVMKRYPVALTVMAAVISVSACSTGASLGTAAPTINVPELAVPLRGSGFTDPNPPSPDKLASPCLDAIRNAPAPPFTLPNVPENLASAPLCLVEGSDGVYVLNLFYRPKASPPGSSVADMLRLGAVSVVTKYNDVALRAPLPVVGVGMEANASNGFAGVTLTPGINARVFRFNTDWVNALWYSRQGTVPVTGMLSGGQRSPSAVASLAASVVIVSKTKVALRDDIPID